MDYGVESVELTLPSIRTTNECQQVKIKQVQKSTNFRTAQIRLLSSHPEVYEPCDDSFALVDALLADRTNLLEHCPRICMEVGCGSGYIITSLALILGQEASGVHYIATDINPDAVRVTRETLEAHGIHAEVVNTDIASGLEMRLAGSVDVIVVNPPYVPTPEDEVGCDGITCAWAGGENGVSIINKILPVADNLLSERGWLYMVTLTANNPSQICLQMKERGFASRIVLQRSTEEENIHIIKFWRDADSKVETKEVGSAKKTLAGRVMDSLLSQLPHLSLRRSVTSNSSYHHGN
ncbi:Methyltransferase domain [Dillenia turbinata]|uniref:Methyltransferase domain n=1 Tax=Dillenia turbinata TaxID=194707 RepID=A0AAN8UT79_9MAGN